MTPRIDGGFHLVLVVREAERSAEWYGRVFGFVVVRRSTAETAQTDASGRSTSFIFTSLFHVPSRLFLGLAEPCHRAAEPFDWQQAGLQHFGFHVGEQSELDSWSSHLDRLGIEHSPILPEGPGQLVRFYDPDRIPVEVFWPNLPYCEELWNTLARTRSRAARERRQQRRHP